MTTPTVVRAGRWRRLRALELTHPDDDSAKPSSGRTSFAGEDSRRPVVQPSSFPGPDAVGGDRWAETKPAAKPNGKREGSALGANVEAIQDVPLPSSTRAGGLDGEAAASQAQQGGSILARCVALPAQLETGAQMGGFGRGERGSASLAHLAVRPRFVLENVTPAASSCPAEYREAG